MQMIRYHPLIDGDTDGLEKVPIFLSEPMSQKATDSIEIHCPLCGAVLRQMAQNHDANKLGLYTCDRCRQ